MWFCLRPIYEFEVHRRLQEANQRSSHRQSGSETVKRPPLVINHNNTRNAEIEAETKSLGPTSARAGLPARYTGGLTPCTACTTDQRKV